MEPSTRDGSKALNVSNQHSNQPSNGLDMLSFEQHSDSKEDQENNYSAISEGHEKGIEREDSLSGTSMDEEHILDQQDQSKHQENGPTEAESKAMKAAKHSNSETKAITKLAQITLPHVFKHKPIS